MVADRGRVRSLDRVGARPRCQPRACGREINENGQEGQDGEKKARSYTGNSGSDS